jgi:hypothetical protein
VLSTADADACRSGTHLTAPWPQDRSSGLHGLALPHMDFWTAGPVLTFV